MDYRHIILSGTGHIGSVLANKLISQGESVLVIGHNAKKAADWDKKGACFEVVDIQNSKASGGSSFVIKTTCHAERSEASNRQHT